MKLFIFGATGDLVKRKVLPALEEIKNIKVITLGRKELDNNKFNEVYCIQCSNALKNRLDYKKIEFKKNFCDECLDLLDKSSKNYFYISLPPSLIYEILNEIATLKEKGYKIQILIEKPFGNSLNQAKLIKEFIESNNLKEELYLADHYLFKEEVLNLNVNKKISKVEVKSLEKEGINNRLYYDEVGAIKDMVQSHLLNILFKILKIEEEKISLSIKDVKISQYKEYEQEINKKSNTETYVKINGFLNVGDKRVNITLETGKRLQKKETLIKINEKEIIFQEKNNPYIEMLNQFIKEKKDNFPSVNQAIKTWEITEQIIRYIQEKNIVLDKY